MAEGGNQENATPRKYQTSRRGYAPFFNRLKNALRLPLDWRLGVSKNVAIVDVLVQRLETHLSSTSSRPLSFVLGKFIFLRINIRMSLFIHSILIILC